jgi:hypothetical protein
MTLWTVPRAWPNETVFIVCGGPSVASQPIERLRGRRVIAVNSSFTAVPFADVLFFGDSRWWQQNRRKAVGFGGLVVTSSPAVEDPRVKQLRHGSFHIGLSADPQELCVGRTSTQGAMNLAVHFGASRIVLIGADMQSAEDGRTHHHDPHPWPQNPGCWDEQMKHMGLIVGPLASLGIEVLNASPVSRLPWWPKVSLADVLDARI